jgi:hypothetical protein
MKRFLVFILAIAMIATLAAPAGATQPDDPGARSAQAHAAVFERAVERMTEHLSLAPDGTLALDVPSGRAIGVPGDVFSQLEASLAKTNEMILAGDLDGAALLRDGYVETPIDLASMLGIESEGATAYASSSCNGVTKTVTRWWGVQFYLNSCDTQTIIGLLTSGAGIGAICAVVGAPVTSLPCGLIAGLLTVGVGYVIAVAGQGNGGIIINYTWVGAWWLSPQH